MTFFVFCFWVKKNPNKNQLGFHMRYHFFLHHGWFVQNLGKDFISTIICTRLYVFSTKNRFVLSLLLGGWNDKKLLINSSQGVFWSLSLLSLDVFRLPIIPCHIDSTRSIQCTMMHSDNKLSGTDFNQSHYIEVV